MRLLVLTAICLGAGSAAQGCSLVYKGDYYQCETDLDCDERGFEGRYCDEHYVCQNSLEYCNTNAECIDRNSSETFICRQNTHRCVKLTTKACPKLLASQGDLRSDDVVVLGSMGFPSIAPTLEAAENGLELARKNFKETLGGLPPVTPGGRPRPVVVVSCDIDPLSNEEYKTVADHLIDEVGVPIIFGPDSSDFLAYVLVKAIDNDVMIFSANNTGAVLTDIPGRKGILFRNYHAAEMLQDLRAKLIAQEIEPRVRTKLGLTQQDPIKIAVIHTGDGTQEALIARFRDVLKFNDGKTWSENGSNYKEFSYGDVFKPEFEQLVAQVVLDVKAFQPNITIYIGAAEIGEIFVQVETAYPGASEHIVDPTAGTADLFAFVTEEDVRKRLWGVLGGQRVTDKNFANFELQYVNTFEDGTTGLLLFLAAVAYDEYYMTLYAIGAVGKPVFTGREVGQAMFERLRGDTEIEMGVTGIIPAFQRLELGDDIVYQGAFTNSLFDDKGDIEPRGLVTCITFDPSASIPVAETGLYYEPSTGELLGRDTCHPLR